MTKSLLILISLLLSYNAFSSNSSVVTWEDSYDFEIYLNEGIDFREMAMNGKKVEIENKIRNDLISLASKRVSEANLAGAVSFPVIESYIKSSKGLAKAVAALTPVVSTISLGSAILFDGVTSRGTSIAAYRLIADSTFFVLGLTSTFALPMLTVAIIDYSLNTYVSNVYRDYELYWRKAFDWYHYEKLKIRMSQFHKLTDISRYVVGAQSEQVKRMMPWNAPDFIRFTDEFWDDSSIISQEFNSAYPSVMSMFFRANPAYQMDREKIRAHFYIKRLHEGIRYINQSLISDKSEILLTEAKQVYSDMLAKYLKHFSKVIDTDVEGNDDVDLGDEDLGNLKGYAIAQATSDTRSTPHYFLVDVSQSGISGKIPNTDLRAYGFCTGNTFRELMDYTLVTEVYKTQDEAYAAVSGELTEVRLLGLGCRFFGAMEYGERVYISNGIYDYLKR